MSHDLDRSSWTRVKFGDVVRNVNDNTKDPGAAGIDRVIGLEHLDPGQLRIQRWGDLSNETTFTRRVRAGQTLFGKRRAYQRKTAYAEFDAVCSGDILVFESADPDRLLPELLPFIAMTDSFYDKALETSAGSLSPRTRWADLAKFEFNLPPLDQQRQIAALLWCFERHRMSSQVLLCSLELAKSALVDQTMAEFAETGSVALLDDLIEPGRPITYGILKPGLSVPGGVPVVKVRDFPDGVIETDDLLYTSHDIDHAYKRSRLRPGDLLISIRGTVGRLAEVPGNLDGANITQDTARLSIDPSQSTAYVRLALESSRIQGWIARAMTGLAVKGINIGELRKVPIPIPPSKQAEDALISAASRFDTSIDHVQSESRALQLTANTVLHRLLGDS